MTYEYICTSCGHQWEADQRISEDPLKVCPKCGESSAKRQISGGSGFVLKGGGWYADLYSSAGGKKESTADSGDAASNDSSASSDSSSSSGTTPAPASKTDTGKNKSESKTPSKSSTPAD